MDKEKLTSHIKDTDLRIFLIRNLSKAESVMDSHIVKSTEFMNPYQLKCFEDIIRRVDSLNYRIYPDDSRFERKIVQICPDYTEPESLEVPVEALRISGSFKFNKVSHKDYLGSILGLGIKREEIGDIYVHERYGYLMLKKNMADYVTMNLTSISRENVNISQVDLDEIEFAEEKFNEIIINISSKRADSIIAEIFNVSRSKSQELILAEKLYVDFEKYASVSREINDGSLISLRGYGRAVFDETLGETKKKRLRARVKIIL